MAAALLLGLGFGAAHALAGSVELESGFVLEEATPPPGPMPGGCFAVAEKDYKFAPGGLFPSTPTYPHGMRPVDTAGQCCDMCKSFKNCSFWTFENGGTPAKPACYQYKQACCLLKTEAARGGSAHSATSISGSMKAVEPLTCRNGTECGGTNEWTTWHDTRLPNSNCTADWCNPGTMPYPPSKDLTGWEYKSGCNPGYGSGNVKGSSADTFYPSWGADDKLYTGFNDGTVVDDVTGKSVRAACAENKNGQAVIVGADPFALNMTNVRTYDHPPGYSAHPFGVRGPVSSLAYNGTWWYGTTYIVNYLKTPWATTAQVGPLADFRHSTDAGATWVEPRLNATGPTDNLFGESPFHNTTSNQVRFPMPHWVDFGKNMEHSPDGKAYVVSHGNDGTSTSSDEAWTLGNQVFMARVAPTVAAIDDRTKWEFYAGGHGAAATWVPGDVSKAKPLIEWTNHTGDTAVTYFAGIKKYVMAINTVSTYPVFDRGNFDTWFLESDDITGPWSYVTYMRQFGPQVEFANFPSKFSAKRANTSAKTFDAFLMFSANYDPQTGGENPPNSAYHMNLQQARFKLSDAFAARLEAHNNGK